MDPERINTKKIIPVTISKLLNGETVEIFGDGLAIRTFIYIDDVAETILNAVELSRSEGAVNVVGDTAMTIEDTVKLLIKIHGNNVDVAHLPSHVANRNLIFDNTKLKKTLLKRFTPLEDGLREEYLYMKEKKS